MILADTDICIEILRGSQNVLQRMESSEEVIAISFITVGELFYGAEKSQFKTKILLLVEEFLLATPVIHSSNRIMKRFGTIKSELEKIGQIIPDADILIAATALCECSKLISGNIKHLKRIPELNVQNWIC